MPELSAGAAFMSILTCGKSDTEILCRLEYRGEKAFYLLNRHMQA
jgi:hypothetical protein